MSLDVMKQALEYTRPGAIVPVTPETVKILVDALRLAIEQAEKQEPVAHLIEYGNGEKELRFQPNGWGDKVTPLYAMPQPIEAQKLVAWLTDRQEMYFDKEDARRYSDGFIQPLYTAPPQQEKQEPEEDDWAYEEKFPKQEWEDTAPPPPLTEAELNHLWETIYDHGNGKYEGRQSREQRERAFAILKRIGGGE